MSYSVEIVRKIWNDKTGESVLVKPDGDALGLLEIESRANDGSSLSRLTMTYEQASLVANALRALCDEKGREAEENKQ